MSNRFLRQLIMLQSIPRFPQKTTTRQLQLILDGQGFAASQRTIQRDLKSLAEILPGLQVDGEKDFPGWSWSKEASLRDIPAMNSNIALTFGLVNIFLKEMLPPSVLHYLEAYFDCAEQTLRAGADSDYSKWREKVRVLSRSQQLIPAGVDSKVIAVIYEGLFTGKRVLVSYKPRYGRRTEYRLNPLGMVFRESVIYLVATIRDYVDPRHLALHRIKAAALLDEQAVIPEDFKLDDYLRAGSFEYGENENETIRLKALFFAGAGEHLLETPLAADQTAEKLEDDTLLIEATVNNSAQIRWWLMGFGDNVEVLEPEELKMEFRELAKNLSRIYQNV